MRRAGWSFSKGITRTITSSVRLSWKITKMFRPRGGTGIWQPACLICAGREMLITVWSSESEQCWRDSIQLLNTEYYRMRSSPDSQKLRRVHNWSHEHLEISELFPASV